MKEDIKYPAILKSECNRQIVVTYKEGSAYHIEGEFKGEYSKAYNTHCTKNITRDYLVNTYGKVESKEHAEFIVELLTSNGAKLNGLVRNTGYFYTYKGQSGLHFSFCKDDSCASSDGEKQITIPLPPKEVEEMKNNGDNLVLGCEESKCEEWPKIGDEVTWGNRSVKGEVKALSDGLAWIKNEYGNYCSEYVESLVIPKTPEEEFKCEDIDSMCDYLNRGAEILFNALGPEEKPPKETLNDVMYQGVKCKVLLGADKSGHIVILKDGNYCNPHKDDVQKPKTPEEIELEEIEHNLSDLIMRARDADADDVSLTRSIMSKYNITKKPQ